MHSLKPSPSRGGLGGDGVSLARHSGASRNPASLLFCLEVQSYGNRRRAVAVASAAGCRPNGAPCGAARGRRKSPKGGAQDARQFAACTWMCIQRTPQPARGVGGQDARRPRHRGCVSLVTFFAQAKKVTRSPAGRVEALHLRTGTKKYWIPAFAGMTSKSSCERRASTHITPSPPNPPLEGEG